MKRRAFISLGLGSFAIAAASGCLGARGSEPFRFAAIGDMGTGKEGQYAVAKAMSQRWQSAAFPLVLTTGDNIYPSGEIEKVNEVFERPYAELLQNDVQFYATLGNHDFQTKMGADELAYPGYNMPARHYTFTQQSVQFFALDTNLAYMDGERGKMFWQSQLRWLRAALGRSRAPWKVVFAHHTIYSSGHHGSSERLIEELSPLFARHGVQLYINGHDHHYERTEPIEGTTYVTTGNGAKLRPVGSSDWTAYASSQLGFNTFEVYPNRMVVSAVDTDNAVYDEAVVLR